MGGKVFVGGGGGVQPVYGSLPNQVFPSISSRAASRWPAWQDSSVTTWSRTFLTSGRRQFGQISTGHAAGFRRAACFFGTAIKVEAAA